MQFYQVDVVNTFFFGETEITPQKELSICGAGFFLMCSQMSVEADGGVIFRFIPCCSVSV